MKRLFGAAVMIALLASPVLAGEPENVRSRVEGNKLILEVDLTAAGHPSKSGKRTTIATTHGGMRVEGHPNVEVMLNVLKPAKASAE